MLRSTSRSVLRRATTLATASRPQPPSIRHKSSTSLGSGGSGGRLALTGFVTVAGLAGGTIGYAGFDNEFRKVVEATVPGSKEAFAAVLGDAAAAVESKVEVKKKSDAPPSKLKLASSTGTVPMPEIVQPKSPLASSKPVVEVKSSTINEVKIEPSKKEDLAEVKDGAELISLGFALNDACKEMESKVNKIIEISKVTIEATRHHMALVRSVMDDTPKDEKRAWNDVFEAANKKSEQVKAVNEGLSHAKDAVNKVIDKIEAGRKNSATCESESLKIADQKATLAVNHLEKVVSSLDSAQKEAALVDEYRTLVEEGRQQFQKEIEAILPDSKLSQKSSGGQGSLTEEELNVFMTHAYRKVCQLQQELAKAQTIDQKKSSVDSSGESSLDDNLQSELDSQRRELELEQHRKLTALRDDMEKEMRTQLRRQAGAHADHINDVLEIQSKELQRVHQRSLDESLSVEATNHKRDLARLKGTLDGLDNALDDKSFMASASVETQELWLACVALQKSLKNLENGERISLEDKVKAVEAATKKSEAFSQDEFIKILLNSIPQGAKAEGVASEAEIKSRFNRVEEMAKRTALVDEDGGSLILYGLSYLQNLLVISPSKLEKLPDKSDLLDLDNLNTFDVVWLARNAIEAGDLEQAVKYMNLLKGEPKRQASDWIEEARLHLATEQICEALASYATAIGAEAVPITMNV